MTTPTQAQIEAAKKVLNTRKRFPAWTNWHDAWLVEALAAAAQVGDTISASDAQDRIINHGRMVQAATIERCAQVADKFSILDGDGPEIAAAIRGLSVFDADKVTIPRTGGLTVDGTDPNIIYPGKDADFVFPEESE